MKAHEVRLPQEAAEIGIFGTQFLFEGLVEPLPLVVEEPHAEPACPSGHGPADGAEADDAERLARNGTAEEEHGRPVLKAAAPRQAVPLDDAAGNGEEETEGEVRRGFRRDAGRVGHDDAAPRGGRDIDIVEPHGQVGDDLEAGGPVHDLRVDAVGDHRKDALPVGNFPEQVITAHGPVIPVCLHVAGGFELCHDFVGEPPGKENLLSVVHAVHLTFP